MKKGSLSCSPTKNFPCQKLSFLEDERKIFIFFQNPCTWVLAGKVLKILKKLFQKFLKASVSLEINALL